MVNLGLLFNDTALHFAPQKALKSVWAGMISVSDGRELEACPDSWPSKVVFYIIVQLCGCAG